MGAWAGNRNLCGNLGTCLPGGDEGQPVTESLAQAIKRFRRDLSPAPQMDRLAPRSGSPLRHPRWCGTSEARRNSACARWWELVQAWLGRRLDSLAEASRGCD